MLQFYIARVLAYFSARIILPLVWWFYPLSLLPWINFNGRWVGVTMNYLIESAPKRVGATAKAILWFTDKVHSLIELALRWYVAPDVRDHVEVLTKAFFTPGGLLMLTQLTIIIFVLIRLWRFARVRQKLRKLRKSGRNEPTFELRPRRE